MIRSAGSGFGTFRTAGFGVVAALVALAVAGCSSGRASTAGPVSPSGTRSPSGSTASTDDPTPVGTGPFAHPLPGMPPVIDGDVYGADRPGELSPAVAGDRPMDAADRSECFVCVCMSVCKDAEQSASGSFSFLLLLEFVLLAVVSTQTQFRTLFCKSLKRMTENRIHIGGAQPLTDL